MDIRRNGEIFRLTEEELTAAYFEKQVDFDIVDVTSELEMFIDGSDDPDYIAAAKRILQDPDKLLRCAVQKRRNEDKYNMQWQDAASEAVNDAVFAEVDAVENG